MNSAEFVAQTSNQFIGDPVTLYGQIICCHFGLALSWLYLVKRSLLAGRSHHMSRAHICNSDKNRRHALPIYELASHLFVTKLRQRLLFSVLWPNLAAAYSYSYVAALFINSVIGFCRTCGDGTSSCNVGEGWFEWCKILEKLSYIRTILCDPPPPTT